MTLKEKISQDLKQAMLARDEARLSTLRMIWADILNLQKSISVDYQITDQDVLKILNKQVKSHQESIELFKKALRNELVEKEIKEVSIIRSYLPEQLGEEEVEKIVEETLKETGASTLADMGKVMQVINAKVAGRASSSVIASMVKEKLQG